MENLIKDTTKMLRLLVEYKIPGTPIVGVRPIVVEKESDVEAALKQDILLNHRVAPVEKLIFKIIREIGTAIQNTTVSVAPCPTC
jgi:hypothetical protein